MPETIEKPPSSLQILLNYLEDSPSRYTLLRREKSLKLVWPGLKLSPAGLAELLKFLPRGKRIDGASRNGVKVASLCFNGKLRKGKLQAPTSDGIVIRWLEPPRELEALHEHAEPSFEPNGQCLGKTVLKKNGFSALARIYLCPEQQDPGFVLLNQGRIIRSGGWLDTLKKPEQARLCQVVVDGDVDWNNGVPDGLQRAFKKLAVFAAEKSREALLELPSVSQNKALITTLLESPKFCNLLEKKRGKIPPIPTIKQLLELVHGGGGYRRVAELREHIGLPEGRFNEILGQLDVLLRDGDEVCLSRSLDNKLLLLNQDVLIRLFRLNPEARASEGMVHAIDLHGNQKSLDIPVTMDLKERRAIEALLRYGRLTEGELGKTLGSRRVGGLLENFIGRLEAAGCYILQVAGTSNEGRIFALDVNN